MSRPAVLIELAADPAFARDLSAGGVFVPNCGLALQDEVAASNTVVPWLALVAAWSRTPAT